jgi:CHAT domain-containing protein
MSSQAPVLKPSRSWKRRLLLIFGVPLAILMLSAASAILVFAHLANRVRVPPPIAIKPNDPYTLLAEANRRAWLFNPSAAELFAEAETRFHQIGDERNESWARIGRIRGETLTTSFTTVSQKLGEELQNPLLKSDPRLKLWCLAEKGYTDLDLNPASAKRAWTEALAIANQLGEKQWATRAEGELGILGFLEGNTGKAANLLGGALLKTMKNGDVAGQIRFLEMLGNGYNEVHRYSEALRFFDRAINLASASTEIGFPFMGYEGKSESLLALGRIPEAKDTLQQALSAAKVRQNPGHEAQVLLLIGKQESSTGDNAGAEADLQQADQIAQKFSFYRTLADANFQLARVYQSLTDMQAAENSLELAVRTSRQVGDRYFLPRDLAALAALNVQMNRPSEADALYRQAEDVIDGLLVNANASYWRSGLSAALGDIYVQHFELASHQRNIPHAVEIIERVRGRAAAASLQARSPFIKQSQTELDLENKISDTQLALIRSENKAERPALLDTLLTLERELGLERNDLALSQPEFLSKPASLRMVQASLREDEELLEYVLDEPQAFCITISRQSANITRLSSGRKAIEQLADNYLARIRAQQSAAELAKGLYSVLISPLPVPQEKTRLIIVSDGKLHLLSFDSLMDSSGQYLVKTKTVSYATSASVFRFLRLRMPSHLPTKEMLAIGDVPYRDESRVLLASSSLPHRVVRGFADLFGARLDNLPATREEVLTVSKETGNKSTLLIGDQATEAGFKAQPLDQYKVLHLAVHGITDSDFPDRAALVLGRDRQSKDDGLLQAREIADLHLNADLVTLSACDTAKGKLQGEAGMESLEDAFFTAGARAVVASLWSADDATTGSLMQHFYQHLAEGHDKAISLREAKLDVLRKFSGDVAPFYWAGFILTGEGATPIAF